MSLPNSPFSDKKNPKRISLVAGYDSDGIIHDYVVFLISELSKISDVFYYCDCDLRHGEIDKLEGLVKWAGSGRHGRYDFGSWQALIYKIGWREIGQYDGLILVNDSVYGPIFDLNPIFQHMESSGCDFWGITSSNQIKYHIQSYFLVFNRKIILNSHFVKFWNNIEEFTGSHKKYVVKNEIAMSDLIKRSGFVVGSLIKSKNMENPTCFPLCLMKDFSVPFVKVKSFKNPQSNLLENYRSLINFIELNTNYDYKNIYKHIGRDYVEKNINFTANDNFYINIGFIQIYTTINNRLKIAFFKKNILSLKIKKNYFYFLSKYKIFRTKLMAIKFNNYN